MSARRFEIEPIFSPETAWSLSDREKQVVRVALKVGIKRERIAKELKISPRTVAHHVEHIKDKTKQGQTCRDGWLIGLLRENRIGIK